MEQPTVEPKKHPIRLTILTVTAIILALVLIEPHFRAPPVNHLQVEVEIDPDVIALAKYMKLRTSRIPREIAELQATVIVEAARKEQVPLSLVVAIIEKESLFHPFSVSSANASGLMQVLVETGVEIDPDRKYDLTYNVQTGCKILKSKLNKSGGKLTPALAAYSGNAEGYSDDILANVGRWTLYRERQDVNVASN